MRTTTAPRVARGLRDATLVVCAEQLEGVGTVEVLGTRTPEFFRTAGGYHTHIIPGPAPSQRSAGPCAAVAPVVEVLAAVRSPLVVAVLYKMYQSQSETRHAKHASINEVLPSEIWNWVSGFVETPKSAMALATVRKGYDNHCGYINCWVDGRSPNCETACVWRMYKFCRIVAEMASKLWRYVNVFNEFILHRGFFNLRIGIDLNEDSGDEVVCVGGHTGHIYFQCGDLGHSFDGRTRMSTCCLADEL